MLRTGHNSWKKKKLDLTVQLACFEADHQSIVRDFIPMVVGRLQTSVEYRMSLVVPISLSSTVGWLGGLSLGRTEEEIAKILPNTSNLDIEGSKTWREKHKEVFTLKYPYVQKVKATTQDGDANSSQPKP
ncbi:hypothetical protein Tco_0322990 [Tanacetum coccineum]